MEKYGAGFGVVLGDGIPLTQSMICSGLSNIGRPVDATQLAYLTFEASSK